MDPNHLSVESASPTATLRPASGPALPDMVEMAVPRSARGPRAPPGKAGDADFGHQLRADGTEVGVAGMTQSDLLKNILDDENRRE